MNHHDTDHSLPAPRLDLYAAVHKGLRAKLCDALVRLGATDPSQPKPWSAAAERVLETLAVAEQHLRDEERYIERALNDRAAPRARDTSADHRHHERSIAALRSSVAAIESTPLAHRAPLARALYLDFAEFVADNIAHMRVEETHNNEALWRLFTDDELASILRALVAEIPPDVERMIHECMLPAMHHAERVAMLASMKQLAPPAVLEEKLAIAARTLDAREHCALCAALEVAPR